MSEDDSQTMILCCLCSNPITPNAANMCISCVKTQYDITEKLSKEETISFCRGCERYHQPPSFWLPCELESKELLQVCLKKVKGLEKASNTKLMDASFVWTEPHSKRIKVKIVVQRLLFEGMKLQQSHLVNFTVVNLQCPQCKKLFTNMVWSCLVQLRQRVSHRKTFLYLEQLILKHYAHRDAINIRDRPDGIDFYYDNEPNAKKIVDFISQFVSVRTVMSKRLISHDSHSNIHFYKKTYSMEICPICKGDVICLPKHLKRSLGGIGPIVLAWKVSKGIHFIDPFTLQSGHLHGKAFWEKPFKPFGNKLSLSKFYVVDVEVLREQPKYKCRYYKLADVQVCRYNDVGAENIIYVRTHLGHLLQPGDLVMGYDFGTSNFNDENLKKMDKDDIPEVVLVNKHYKKRVKGKLKRMAKKMAPVGGEDGDGGGGGEETPTRGEVNDEEDVLDFLQDYQNDEDLQKGLQLEGIVEEEIEGEEDDDY